MQVLILHGLNSDSKDNWFPWLKKELEAKGITVYCPDLPNNTLPNQVKWLEKINQTIEVNRDLVIVGHSLGTIAALRFLENLKDQKKIIATILVAGFTQSFGVKIILDFFKTPFNWDKIRRNSKRFTVISSDNDPYLPISEGQKLAENLNADFIIEKNAGHIDIESGFNKYELILELVLKSV
ncbi:serine hydrolase family protein [Candidatus Micrarchaeota archaeon]|nr:serine hydrolase family protein [Candidatus Micrarchaeota archaeon]